ncbi:MAG: hypothetical protein ACREA2_17585 [Blastocatellia bacterium]
MRKKSTFYQLTLGLLIGALIIPAQPAQAQWAVHDPPQYALQIKKRIEEVQRHIQTFDNAVKQYTTLRGVLGNVEDMVAKQRNAINTMSNIGRTVRASLELKEQAQAIITTRLTMLKSIDDRLRMGIFDPEADLRDLEDYLRTSIGRSSQDTLANLERLQRMDNTLERMIYDLKLAHAARAKTALEKMAMKAHLDSINSQSDQEKEPISTGNLMKKISDCESLIAQYTTKIEDLRGKIKEHTKKYYVLMDERIKFAEQVDSTNKAWSKFNDAMDNFERALRD